MAHASSAEQQLDQDIARLEASVITVLAVTEEGTNQLLLDRNNPLGPQLLKCLGGWKVRVFFDDELDNEATVEENGIDDGATLMVQLLKAVPFKEVLPELLRLNPRMTEKEATRGAQLDADGMLINWNLECCNQLDVLPECIGDCTALQTLYLMDCNSLTSLGDGISGCVALKRLDSRGCKKLTSLGGIGGLTSLTILNVSNTAIKELPESIGGCVALKELLCYRCTKLTSLGGIGGLTSLTILDVSNTAIKELPESIGGCKALQKLDLAYCGCLTSLGDGLVQQLKSQGCSIER